MKVKIIGAYIFFFFLLPFTLAGQEEECFFLFLEEGIISLQQREQPDSARALFRAAQGCIMEDSDTLKYWMQKVEEMEQYLEQRSRRKQYINQYLQEGAALQNSKEYSLAKQFYAMGIDTIRQWGGIDYDTELKALQERIEECNKNIAESQLQEREEQKQQNTGAIFRKYLQEGEFALQNGDYLESFKSFREAREVAPEEQAVRAVEKMILVMDSLERLLLENTGRKRQRAALYLDLAEMEILFSDSLSLGKYKVAKGLNLLKNRNYYDPLRPDSIRMLMDQYYDHYYSPWELFALSYRGLEGYDYNYMSGLEIGFNYRIAPKLITAYSIRYLSYNNNSDDESIINIEPAFHIGFEFPGENVDKERKKRLITARLFVGLAHGTWFFSSGFDAPREGISINPNFIGGCNFRIRINRRFYLFGEFEYKNQLGSIKIKNRNHILDYPGSVALKFGFIQRLSTRY